MLFATKPVIIFGFWINPWWFMVPAVIALIGVGILINRQMSKPVDED